MAAQVKDCVNGVRFLDEIVVQHERTSERVSLLPPKKVVDEPYSPSPSSPFASPSETEADSNTGVTNEAFSNENLALLARPREPLRASISSRSTDCRRIPSGESSGRPTGTMFSMLSLPELAGAESLLTKLMPARMPRPQTCGQDLSESAKEPQKPKEKELRNVSSSSSSLSAWGALCRTGLPRPASFNSNAAEASLAEVMATNEVKRKMSDEFEFSEQILGTGSSGAVRTVKGRHSDTSYAAKSFNMWLLNRRQKEELAREVAVHTSLSHPRIVQVEAVYEDEDQISIIMEKLEGGDLFDRLSSGGKRMCESRTARIMVDVLRALAYCHARNVVHRDVKPENIVFEAQDRDDCKLVDFGFSVRCEPGKTLDKSCGSIPYIAPEVLRGNGYTEKSDLWSVGTVIYTLLTLKAVYRGTEAEVQHRARLGDVHYCHSFHSISKQGQHLIKSLLTLDYRRRPSAAECLAHPWFKRFAREAAAEAHAEALAELNKTDMELRLWPRVLLTKNVSLQATKSLHQLLGEPLARQQQSGSSTSTDQKHASGMLCGSSRSTSHTSNMDGGASHRNGKKCADFQKKSSRQSQQSSCFSGLRLTLAHGLCGGNLRAALFGACRQ